MPARKIAEDASPTRRRASRRAAKAFKATPDNQPRSDAPTLEAPPPPPPEVAATPADQRTAPNGKLGALVALLSRPEGATIVAMSEATGWLPHSVRGALSGALKKTRGYAIASSPAEGGRVYRIVAGETVR